MDTIELLTSSHFTTPLLVGVAITVVAAFVAVVFGKAGSPPPLAGPAIVVAAMVALDNANESSSRLLAGIAALAAAGVVAGLVRDRAWVGALASLPGAWLVAGEPAAAESWHRAAGFAAIVFGGWLMTRFVRRHRARAWAPAMFVISVGGAFLTVPDTEQAVVVLGAALPMIALTIPRPIASFGAVGAFAGTGLLVWVAMVGGAARPGAIVGAMASLGLLVAAPLARFIASAPRTQFDLLPEGGEGTIVVLSGQLLVVFVASRVAGLQESAWIAAAIAVPVLVVAGFLTVFVGRKRREVGKPA